MSGTAQPNRRTAFVFNASTAGELQAGRADAKRVHALLTSEVGGCTAAGPQPLLDYDGGMDILSVLARVLEQWRRGDQLIFYFSGHGAMRDGTYQLKCGSNDYCWVPFRMFRDVFQARRVVKGIVVLDACESGAALTKGGRKDLTEPDLKWINPAGFATVTSSGASQYSFELRDRSASVFTSLFCSTIEDGLGRRTPDGNIGVSDLVDRINHRLTLPEFADYPQRALYTIDQASGTIWIARNRSGRSEPVEENTASTDAPCSSLQLSDQKPREDEQNAGNGTDRSVLEVIRLLHVRDYDKCEEVLESLLRSNPDDRDVLWSKHILEFERYCVALTNDQMNVDPTKSRSTYVEATLRWPDLRILPGAYGVEEPLGFGGFSHVYRVSVAEEKYAAKHFRPDILANRALANQVRDRLSAIAKMTELAQKASHGIARIVGYYPCYPRDAIHGRHFLPAEPSLTSDDGTIPCLTILYEYIEGRSLRHFIPTVDSTTRSQKEYFLICLETLIKVCDALVFAHEHGVYHLDISPSNILIDGATWDEETDIKIIDFDTARLAAGSWDLSRTVPAIVGKLDYVDPWIMDNPSKLDGVGGVDGRSDVYSVAMLVKAMLCHGPRDTEKPSGRCEFASPLLDELAKTPIRAGHDVQTAARCRCQCRRLMQKPIRLCVS